MKPANYLIKINDEMFEYFTAQILRIRIKESNLNPTEYELYKRVKHNNIRYKYVKITYEDLLD